ncbi:3-epi-6-deoxocathasterone 23-monooxygenase CYP90D1-like [Camellia sinensis]|uniref:3-epi-6-deoxocathasterone 23-monooxygenase CYP90D1-like n=1 Tax=Camellia sinensis TaxID=4442 RepID=UPI001035D023|nr:3-epi-6-deoxocathasterone 23-monooxygenase CYP90D1-like [Camellia sinensis]
MRSYRRSPIPLPLGTLGWPFLGESISFISCAYSDHPETFMDRRRHMYSSIDEVATILLSQTPDKMKELVQLTFYKSPKILPSCVLTDFIRTRIIVAVRGGKGTSLVVAVMVTVFGGCGIVVAAVVVVIVFQVLVKALVSMDPGDDTEFLKKQFQEFMAGLISLPINIPGSRLHKSLQGS